MSLLTLLVVLLILAVIFGGYGAYRGYRTEGAGWGYIGWSPAGLVLLIILLWLLTGGRL